MEKIICILLIVIGVLTAQHSFSTACHPKCQCIWRKNKQTAECASVGFQRIPFGLAPTIQILNLTGNNFTLLPPNAFLASGLVHLQKLYLARCAIEHIDDFALNRISNLVELDLSYNLISYIPTAAFRHLPLLRHLILNGNPLVIIPPEAFVELKTLTILEISNCKIDTIAIRAFEGLDKLEVLKMDSNELPTLHAKTMTPFQFLHGITLDGNPWTCDCELRGLRQWLHENNVPYIPPTCYRPLRLREKIWSEVAIEDYACAPAFLNTSSAMNVLEGSNVTLVCKVAGDPIPSVQWLWRERVITNLSEGISSRQTFIMAEYAEKEKLSTLRISSVQEPNAGVYTCVASNTAGRVSKNFTLMVSRVPVTGVHIVEEEKTQEVKDEEKVRKNSKTGMALAIVAGAVMVLVLLCAALYFGHRNRQRTQRKRIETNPKRCNSVNSTSPQTPQDNSDYKILHPNPVRLRDYGGMPANEMDHCDSVWQISDHRSTSDLPWDGRNLPASALPITVTKQNTISGHIPMEPEDLQHELSNSMRKMSVDRQRELGDGSSEMDAIETEIKITFDPHTIREQVTNRLTTFLPAKSSDGPDLIDHARAPAGDMEGWQNGPTQAWLYEEDDPYYRTSTVPSKNRVPAAKGNGAGESAATEV